MYKHILLAVDGSTLADEALKQGLELAQAIGARATIIHVTAPWSSVAVGEVAVMFPPQEYEANMAAAAAEILKRSGAVAEALAVPFDTLTASDPQPYRAILAAAADKGCDLIVMGSHGRRGIAGLLLGSETTKTLTHGKIPVLVYRE
ncbi:MAG: universal stress protein [Hyphomicrobium sp.]|jgi:nucleotide-binding universal stress UspA family protein